MSVAEVGPIEQCDVAIVGDGPAGSALACALRRSQVDVLLIGTGAAWTSTYMSWCDDLDGLPLLADVSLWADRFESVRARFGEERTIERSYGVIDNAALRAHLQSGVRTHDGRVDDVSRLPARLVVDATGWPSGLDPSDRTRVAQGAAPRAWQTAFGVVLDSAPVGALGRPTVMDFSAPWSVRGVDGGDGDIDVPTFAYSFPVHDGWLVEETVLAGPPIDPDALAARLARRLGVGVDSLLNGSRRIERVRIPMGAPIPAVDDDGPTVRFGAAAGMIHTATGYSVAASLRTATRVADAIAERLAEPRPVLADDMDRVRQVVWPTSLRRSRSLHMYGLDVLLQLDQHEIARFFDTFFDLDENRWPPYMRIDTDPKELAGVMSTMFRRADWSLRRRLVRGSPRSLLASLRS
jgi:lycopene beta-cyclase